VQLGLVLFSLSDFGKVQGLQLRKHAYDARPVIGIILNGIPMQSQAIEIWQLLQFLDIGKSADFVSVQIDHFQGRKFEYVIADRCDVIEAQVEPGNIFGELDNVKSHFIQSRCVNQVIVG